MEVWRILIWSIVSFLALGGLIFVTYGLRRTGFGESTKTRQHERELSEHINSLMRKLEDCKRDKKKLTKKRKQLKILINDSSASNRADDQHWRLDDLDWRMDDLDWTISDLSWDIRDSKFEIDIRKEQNRTAKATFWTVLGAAVFAFAGLIVDILSIFY